MPTLYSELLCIALTVLSVVGLLHLSRVAGLAAIIAVGAWLFYRPEAMAFLSRLYGAGL